MPLLWKKQRDFLAIQDAEKEAEHFFKHNSKKEIEEHLVSAIKKRPSLLENLPSKAQEYYKKNYTTKSELSKKNSITQATEKTTKSLPQTLSQNPLTREEIILDVVSLKKFHEDIDEKFVAVYVDMKNNRERMERIWTDTLQNPTSPFDKIYSQEMLKKIQYFKTQQLIDSLMQFSPEELEVFLDLPAPDNIQNQTIYLDRNAPTNNDIEENEQDQSFF